MSAKDWLEDKTERGIFASRWLLAPIYVGLVLSLVPVLLVFSRELIHLFQEIFRADTPITEQASNLTLGILGLLDLGLLANLILIVIFAGYENFVSKINVAEGNVDRPHWMGHVDFSGLKIKLIGSLVAISVIELLKDFVRASDAPNHTAVEWRILIHLTFLLSGVLFAVMDYIGDKRKIMLDEHHQRMAELGTVARHDRADGT
jgi:uncharacterized protein (TIGR00645 family)